jgi:hypothetical protein
MIQPATRSLPSFVSAKCRHPVALRHPAVRIALVQASLDPAVRAIGPIGEEAVVGIGRDAVVLTRDDGRVLLDVVPARPSLGIPDVGPSDESLRRSGLGVWTVSAADLRAEPGRSNADVVWAHAGLAVPVGLRIGLLQVLADDGPMPLGELCRRVRSDRDPVAAVMALACLDLVEIDLFSGPLGPATAVRSRT